MRTRRGESGWSDVRVCLRAWDIVVRTWVRAFGRSRRWQRESGYLLEEKVGASPAGRQVGTPSYGNGALSACPVRGAREGEDLVLIGPGLPTDKES